jgi:hypothetical protein
MHDGGGMGSSYQGPENLSRGLVHVQRVGVFFKEGFQGLGVCWRNGGGGLTNGTYGDRPGPARHFPAFDNLVAIIDAAGYDEMIRPVPT